MNCSNIHVPKQLVALFRSEDQPTVERTVKCFYSEFFESFKSAFYSIARMIKIERTFTSQQQEELTQYAFNDGLFFFYRRVREYGFMEKAMVKTAFFEFYKRCLWGIVKKKNVELGRLYSGDPDDILDASMHADESEAAKEEMRRREKEHALFEKALGLLDKRCADLLRWRKLEKLGNEEISERSGIKPGNVTNEVYRCSLRLKEIIDELKNNNPME